MTDLNINIETMELLIENGDFVLNTEVSTQNGALLLYTKNTNLDFPTAGVGLGLAINSFASEQINLLNIWKTQCKNDGAKSAGFVQKVDLQNNIKFETTIYYPI